MLERHRRERQIRKNPAHAIDQTTALPCEYAKKKKRFYPFAVTTMCCPVASESRSGSLPDSNDQSQTESAAVRRQRLSVAAQRALAEAKARRQATAESARPMPKEFQGPTGPEPTRYGDWENKGIASDF
jgi:hypothetical protein